MASVSSLDQDMRNLRMSRYTPQAASEVRTWIESTLNGPLPPGDLLEVLRDGVALCKLANLLLPSPGVKYKSSPMPFIQMENVSHFLKACEMPPLNMPAHDRFLTVDLYEAKDPAQVLQCLSAFSRQAHAAKPSVFRTTIGPKRAGGTMSPSTTGGAGTNGSASWNQTGSFGRASSPTKPSAAMPSSARAMSPALTGGSTGSQQTDGGTKSPSGPVSSWSKRSDEGNTAPAWNIHQYGYMGGASQGNQGISFGARRQITSQAPSVPSLAEKERMRKEKAAVEERSKQQAEEAEQRKLIERESEEQQVRIEEERRWEEETRRLREQERQRVEKQKRQWAEQERKWKEEEEARRKEEAEMQAMQKRAPQPPEKPRVPSSGILRGQTLSQYQREQAALGAKSSTDGASAETPEQARVRELEKQLEEARERERQYQAEREEKMRNGSRPGTAQAQQEFSSSRPQTRQSEKESEASWTDGGSDEREFLRRQWQSSQGNAVPTKATTQHRTLPSQPEAAAPSSTSRPLPQPAIEEPSSEEDEPPSLPQRMQFSNSASSVPHLDPASAPSSSPLGSANRPLPTPDKDFEAYTPEQLKPNRTDRFLSTATAPANPQPRISTSREAGDASAEQNRDRDTRLASQQKTKAGAWASKSLLEREMERERERQREWEANQETVKAAPRDASQGTEQGQSWDVNQYGYMGGDGMNRGSSAGSGINFGGRRQILGPREMGSTKRS